jgi:hypothetical protein
MVFTMKIEMTENRAGFFKSEGKVLAALIVMFVLTRLLLFTAFPFTTNFLDIGMQLIDPVLLEEDLLGSLMYLHSQPPLFNAFLGLVLKAAPTTETAAVIFKLFYAGMGLFLVLGIYYLALALGAGRRWSLAAAGLFIFWPPNSWSHIFNHPPSEKWLSYDYPVTVMLLVMALLLVRYRDTDRPVYLALFLLTSAAASLTRPVFHLLLWTIPLIAWVLWRVRKGNFEKTRLFISVSVLTLFLAAWPAVRNYMLTGWFTASTFQGMNLASRTAFVPQEELVKMVGEGTVTPLALVPRFSEPEVYLKYYGENRLVGKRVLDAPVKSTGHPNFNHHIIIRASREYQHNTRVLAAAYPGAVMKAVANGVYSFFGFEPNQYLWQLNALPWGFWKVEFPPLRPSGALWPVRYIVGPVLFAAVYFAVIFFMAGRRPDPVCIFIAFALTYIFTISTIAELGHNSIFRKQMDPLLFSGAAAMGSSLWSRMSSK